MRRFDDGFIDEVRGRVDLAGMVAERVTLHKRGREWKGLCPFHAEKTPSFTVVPKEGFYHCFGCGAHGNAISWLRETEGVSFVEAIERLAMRCGMDLPDHPQTEAARRKVEAARKRADQERQFRERQAEKARAAQGEKERRRAWEIWQQGRSITTGDAADRYLSGARAIDPAVYQGAPMLRIHPGLDYWADEEIYRNLGRWPALLGAYQDRAGRFRAVHITYLAPDGSGKLRLVDEGGESRPSKKVRGRIWGSALKLAPPMAVGGRVSLAGAEGVENALSVQMATGRPCWALYSLGNFAGGGRGRGAVHPGRKGKRLPSPMPDLDRPGFVPPEGVEIFTWCRDADNGDPAAAACLVDRGLRRLTARGVEARVACPPEGMDFNDLLRRGGP